MKKTPVSLRGSTGMHFSRECRFYFWVGWAGWVLGSWAVLYGEYTWRVPDPPAGYLLEAGVALLSWLAALALADHTAIRFYRQSWQRLKQGTLAPVVLDQQVVERIRSELRADPLLRWLRPPASRDMHGQLMTASLWWQALSTPEGARRSQRYSEWVVDMLLGYVPLAAAAVIAVVWPSWRGWGMAALVGGCGCLVLGWSLIRLAARRQAIVDYFSTWMSSGAGDE